MDQLGLLMLGIVLTVGLGLYAGISHGWIVPLLSLGLIVDAFMIKLTTPLAFAFPKHDATVGDLARDVLALNHARLVDEVGFWNKKDVWEALCRVIVLQTAVDREKMDPEARIVGDLGID